MKKGIFALLILAGIGMGFFGFTKMQDSSKSLEIGNLELKAKDSDQNTQAYLLMGGGVLCLVLGIGGLRKS